MEVKELFDRGLAIFEKLYHVRPADSLIRQNDAVALFPNHQGKSAAVHRTTSPPGWLCGAGCWFFEGLAGQAALQQIGQRSRDTAGRWLQDIDGTFALALQDEKTGNVVVVTDRLGTLHVYTAGLRSTILICTSSLVLAALLRPRWDPDGCRQFLAVGSIFETRTQWAGIEKLAPASLFEYSRGNSPAGANTGSCGETCMTARASAERRAYWQPPCETASR